MRRCAAQIAIIFALGLATHVYGQGTQTDYARAENLLETTRNKVFRGKVEPHWYGPDKKHFWYRNELPDSTLEFVSVDTTQGVRRQAFDHEQLAMSLSKQFGKPFDAKRLPFGFLEYADDGSGVRFNLDGKGWSFSFTSGQLSECAPIEQKNQKSDDREGRRRRSVSRGETSPDGARSVFVRNHNLILKEKETNLERVLTTDGTPEDYYEPNVFWAPNSVRFVAIKTRKAETHTIHLIESAPKDQIQPKLHSFDYLKPGDRIAHPRVHLFDVTNLMEESASAEQPVNTISAISDDLFPNPWSIDEVRWSPDSGYFTFAYNQRGHQTYRIVRIDCKTRQASSVVNEECKTFFDYNGKKFTHYVDSANEIVWMSERSGWNHLYLIDSPTGKVKNSITQGEWVVRGVDLVDEERRVIWFRASGVYSEQDPYFVHFGRVNFDGSGLVWLTRGDGTHTVEFSPDRKFLIDTYSRVDQPPITELRSTDDGSLVCDLEKADWSKLIATGWQPPERFVAKGRDGTTDIYGVIWRPTNFDVKRSYPVIEYIYAGPHSAFVPKSFSSYHPPQSMAELGFVVVQMDGMGTSHRSKAFHDVCWKNLGDSGFPDRMAWIRSAAEKYHQLDISRVGIYGGSAGGQSSTRALLAFGDFYKVAVSDCGCHDNRMDKIWWNELWMSYPIGEHYNEQSNVTQAHNLKGKLMLVVGELDRNVDPASTMQVVNALIKADKDFDLLVIPGAGHGAAESAYGKRRRMDFFVRHLLGVEPRSNP